QTVRVRDLAAAPGAQIFALAVEDHHRGILALEHVNAILRIGRHPADQPERLSVGQFEEIADLLVGVFARPDLCHGCLPPKTRLRKPASAAYTYLGLSASRTAAMRLGSAAGGSMPARSTCNSWPTVLLRAPQPRFIASVNSS